MPELVLIEENRASEIIIFPLAHVQLGIHYAAGIRRRREHTRSHTLEICVAGFDSVAHLNTTD